MTELTREQVEALIARLRAAAQYVGKHDRHQGLMEEAADALSTDPESRHETARRWLHHTTRSSTTDPRAGQENKAEAADSGAGPQVLSGLMDDGQSSAWRQRDIDLTEAAHDLLVACDMEQHNEDIFKGKWKKGSKAWKGEFVASMKKDAMERIRALTDPRKPSSGSLPNTPGSHPFDANKMLQELYENVPEARVWIDEAADAIDFKTNMVRP